MAALNSKEKLFGEFQSISSEEWAKKIEVDLKGGDPKKLIWKTQEGFEVNPYYREEDLTELAFLNVYPDEFPFVRGNKKQNNDWEVRQDIIVNDIQAANKKALFVLDKGITSLGFVVPAGKISSQSDFSKLLENIVFECIHLNFVTNGNTSELLDYLIAEVKSKNIDKTRIIGSVDFDPIGTLATTGGFYNSEDADITLTAELVKKCNEELPNYRIASVSAQHYCNAGASLVQQLAFALAHGNEYLSKLTDKGLSIDDITKHIEFKFGVGGNYFMEIAKLRAARLLWAKIVEAYKPNSTDACKMYIHSTTSDWNKTIYDPYVNMLRSTTEAMSAAIAGSDSIHVKPFDASFKSTTDFSERIARNTQIILKEEAYFDKIVDPSAGSYYIEKLTESIAEHVWTIFCEIDKKGGFIASMKEGYVQNLIAETSDKRNKLVATRREVFLGTNQYPNSSEAIKEQIDESLAFPTQKTASNKVVEPLKLYRGSMEFEKLRLQTENNPNGQPKVFLLTYGHPVWKTARANFSTNFFGCAGYEIINNAGFKTAEEGVNAALKANADIVVLCSSDEEYTDLAPQVQALLNDKAILVVAGAPANMDDLKAKGIEHFIHVKANLYETLVKFNELLGIKKSDLVLS